MHKSDAFRDKLSELIQRDDQERAVMDAVAYMRDLEAEREEVAEKVGLFMAGEQARNAELAKAAAFGHMILAHVKDVVAQGRGDEWTNDVLELAADKGVGNVRHVAYDPALHGDMDAEPGDMVWYWGGQS